jgi:hypothetical protein
MEGFTILQAGQEKLVAINGRTWSDGLYFLRASTAQQHLMSKVLLQRK